MKTYILLICFIILGCGTASQITFYKPAENESSWMVKVTKTQFNSFICTISEYEIFTGSFSLFSGSFLKEDYFRGKKITMSGYRQDNGPFGKPKILTDDYSYQIVVFIDEKEIAKFYF